MACGPEPTELTPKTSGLETFDGKLLLDPPAVYILVVDDAATAEAAQLRTLIAQGVRHALGGQIDFQWGSCGSTDPAQWHPTDIRLIVVRASAPDAEALVTPLEEPALAWITKKTTEDEADVVIAAATAALEQRLASPGEPFRPLRAAKRAADLVTGARPPSTAQEIALVSSLPSEPIGLFVQVIVAGTRDDEDATVVEALALGGAPPAFYTTETVVAPSMSGDGVCELFGAGTSRLQAWGSQADAHLIAWPCDSKYAWERVVQYGVVDCGSSCHSHPLAVSSDGVAACRLYVDQLDLDGCDPALGLMDPGGAPMFVDRYGSKLRRCEVIQLSGSALDACRSTLECSGCSPGFCVTDVKEVFKWAQCPVGEYLWPIRVVGGPLDSPGGYVYGECQSKDPP